MANNETKNPWEAFRKHAKETLEDKKASKALEYYNSCTSEKFDADKELKDLRISKEGIEAADLVINEVIDKYLE